MRRYKYLIVGGGMAADAAVKGVRTVDREGKIGLISEEPDPPYKRPPLSKGLWTKGTPIEKIWCGTEGKGADVIRATRVTALDLDRQEVTDAHGEVYRYEKLLLATGGAPKRLPFEDHRLIYYRTFVDYQRLRNLANTGQRFVVLGGGFIGAEIAAALNVNGKDVTMVFPEAGIGGLLWPASFSRAVTGYYEQRGIKVVAGLKPSGIGVRQGVCVVQSENGRVFPADGVVAGIGLTPNTLLAARAGLVVGDGIEVDEQLRTRRPEVFAAGDVANFYNPALGRRMRVEHEDNALTMGEHAGRNMAGENQPYHHLPYFYSDLFDAGYEAVGETSVAHEVFTELGDPREKGFIFYLKDKRVRGLISWNLFGRVGAGRALIASPGPHTPDSLRAWAEERVISH